MDAMNPVLRRIHLGALRLFAERGVNQISVSDLAQAAGVARGTIYNNLSSPETLFDDVSSQLVSEMHQRVVKSFDEVSDPAQRLAFGMRFFIRRAHEEPDWGRFFVRFAFNDASLREILAGPAVYDLQTGLDQGRYCFRHEQLMTVAAMIAGAVLGAMLLVQEGHKTWRDAGADATELVLKALGIAPDEAYALSIADLPPLLSLE